MVGIAPANVTLPTITGEAREGKVLTVDNGTWSGTAPFTFSYQWYSCPGGGGVCTALSHTRRASRSAPCTSGASWW